MVAESAGYAMIIHDFLLFYDDVSFSLIHLHAEDNLEEYSELQ